MVEIIKNIDYLRQVSRPVFSLEDPGAIARLLFDGLRQSYPGGLMAMGLSAIQLGYPLRVIALRDDPRPLICLVNPEIVKARGSRADFETCLSLAGQRVKVTRPEIVKVKGLNEYMKPAVYNFRGLQARVACHELDHLNGVLITDYIGNKIGV